MFVMIGEALADLAGQPDPGRASRGSPADVALGSGRLGDPVTLMTRLGRDAFGDMICRRPQASGVRVEGGAETGSRTSLAIASPATALAPAGAMWSICWNGNTSGAA